MAKKRSGYSAQWHKTRLEMSRYLDGPIKNAVGAKMLRLVSDVCRDFQYNYITANSKDTAKNFPKYTGNLIESTGTAVYKSGKLVTSHIPLKVATRHQTSKGRKHIVGLAEAQKMLKEGSRMHPRGIAILFYSAVPYAADVNAGRFPHLKSSSIGYFDRATEVFEHLITTTLVFGLQNGYGKISRKRK